MRPTTLPILFSLIATLWALPAAAIPQVQIQNVEAAAGSDYVLNKRLGLALSTPGSIDDVHVINHADCKAILVAKKPVIKINWTWVPTLMLGSNYTGAVKASAKGSSCTETSLQKLDTETNCVVNGEHTYAIGATFSDEIDLRDLIGRSTTCNEGSEQDAYVYFLVNDQASRGVNQAIVAFKSRFLIDLAGPAVPKLSTVTAGGSNLQLAWTHGDESKVAGSYVYWADLPIEASKVALGTSKASKSDKVTAKTYQIKDLTNGKPYYVAVTAIDANDNESDFSEQGQGTPVEVVDAWQHYQQAGGGEEGGFAACTARPVSTGWAWLVGLMVTALGVRLRRRGVIAAVLAALVAVAVTPAPALATSPLENSIDFRGAFYLPNVDGAFSGKTKPYGDIFDGGSWEYGGSADFRVWDRFGALSLGLGFGWWKQTGKGIIRTSGAASSDATTFKIMPLSFDLVYRLEPMAFKWGVPLVPYAKVGAMYAVWWMLNGTENISKFKLADGTSREALGGTGGYHAAFGIRFLLDVLEPQAAKSFDIEMGVNHSYLFAEYDRRILNDFNNVKSIDLSDGIYLFGLAFDM